MQFYSIHFYWTKLNWSHQNLLSKKQHISSVTSVKSCCTHNGKLKCFSVLQTRGVTGRWETVYGEGFSGILSKFQDDSYLALDRVPCLIFPAPVLSVLLTCKWVLCCGYYIVCCAFLILISSQKTEDLLEVCFVWICSRYKGKCNKGKQNHSKGFLNINSSLPRLVNKRHTIIFKVTILSHKLEKWVFSSVNYLLSTFYASPSI